MNDRHVSFHVHGVKVTFPFEPYAEQRDYCKSVVEAITKQQNAILESPTGTGKTLSLLTSSLAWQQSTNETPRMIFYLSRTHLQLSQAAKEMKKTAYAKVPSVVLASRAHMCLNDEVKGQSQGADISINRACQNAIAKNSCTFYNNYEEKLKARLDWNKVHDIEDLHKFGRANQCCPFYASKKIAETQAALVFMPYNYLLDLQVRKSTQLRLDKSVVIIDEGHNIEAALKDSASAKFTMGNLKTVQENCEKLPAKLSEALMRDKGISRQGYDPDNRRGVPIVDEFKSTKSGSSKAPEKDNKPNTMEELADKLTNDRIQQVNNCARLLSCCQDLIKSDRGRYVDTKCDIQTVITVLRQAGVTFETSDAIITTLESMATFWSIVGVVNARLIAGYMTAITNLSHFISLVYPPGCMSATGFEVHLKSLRTHYSAYMLPEVERDSVLLSSNKLINWTLNLWCLNPGIGLKRVIDDSCVQGPRSIIITSGTLSPIEPIAREMEKDFKIIKEFGHLISKQQMKITILSHSPKNYLLDTTYEKTLKQECQEAVGQTLASLLTALPFGTLVFFPSYRLLKLILTNCESKPYWAKLKQATSIFKESTDQRTFSDDMLKYKKIVDSNGRAVFLGVCRGKLSEGTNLEKNHCRSVIIVGLPFPNRGDPRVQETLAFQARKGDCNGNTWYTNQMRRALGQAIGRVIRSKDDFGMVFLIDPRFTMYKMLVSKWIQTWYPNTKTNDYRQVSEDIRDFFAQHNIDISEFSLANVAGANSTGAFEITTNRRKRPRVSNSSNSFSSSSQSSSQGVNDAPTEKTLQERQAELRAAYTVDRKTYQKFIAQRQTNSQQDNPETKRAKTTQEAFDSIFEDASVAQDDQVFPMPVPQDARGAVLGDAPKANTNQQPPLNNDAPEPKKTKPPSKPRNPMKRQPVGKTDSIKCWVCKNDVNRPVEINCSCKRIGCYDCVSGLNKKQCGDCGETLNRRRFAKKLMNPFQKRDS